MILCLVDNLGNIEFKFSSDDVALALQEKILLDGEENDSYLNWEVLKAELSKSKPLNVWNQKQKKFFKSETIFYEIKLTDEETELG